MDSELEQDLFEVLGGLDPFELLVEDPSLIPLMQDIERDPHEDEAVQLCSISEIRPASVEKDKEQRGERKGRNKDKSNTCTVCAKHSKCYKYYGTMTCTSCREFFSRSIKGGAYKTFLCRDPVANSSCSINSKSWISCRSCRFNQCLAAGMAIPETLKVNESYLTDNSAHEQATHRLIETEQRNDLVIKVKGLVQPSLIITGEEKLIIQQLSLNSIDLATKIVSGLCSNNIDVFGDVLKHMFYGDMYPMSMKKRVEEYMMFCITEIYTRDNLPPRDSLKTSDRFRLLKGNIPIINEYYSAIRLGKRLDFGCNVKSYVHFLSKNQDKHVQERIRTMYSQVRNIIHWSVT